MQKVPERTPLNIVPFIDIMLVLLCIVLSISSFVVQGKIEVKLPSSTSTADTSNTNEAQNRLLEVNAQGEIFFEGQPTSLEMLPMQIEALTPSEHLKLRIDEQSQFAVFIRIVDILKNHAHDNFSIATARK